MTTTAPRETDELWPFTVVVDGQPVSSGVQTCITAYDVRPTDASPWVDAIVRDGRTLLRVSHRAVDDQAWARVTRDDEHALILLGTLDLF